MKATKHAQIPSKLSHLVQVPNKLSMDAFLSPMLARGKIRDNHLLRSTTSQA